jgi:hypothetical protein
MDQAEFEHVANLICKDLDGENLCLLLNAIYRTNTGVRKKLANETGLKEWAIRGLLPVLAKKVTLGIGHFAPDENILLELRAATAWKMAFRLEFETANEIIQSVFAEALAIERFEILLDLFKLAEITEFSLSVNGVTKDEIVAKHQNLLKFIGLRNLAGKLKSCSDLERENLLSDLESLPILKTIDNAISKSAKAHYYWIWSRIHVLQDQKFKAIATQSNFLKILKENSWLEKRHNFFLVREYRPLVSLFLTTNQKANVEQLWFRIGNIKTDSPLTEAVKWQQIYPNRIGYALEMGKVEQGRDAVSQVVEMISANPKLFPDNFICENLYYSTYFLLAIGELESANRLNIESLKMQQRTKNHAIIWSLTRLFEILINYKLEDESEVIRLVRNFRNTNEFKSDSFYEMAVKIIVSLVNSNTHWKLEDTISSSIATVKRWKEVHPSSFQLDYFDLSVWLQSEKDGCTMAEIFGLRASDDKDFSQTAAV